MKRKKKNKGTIKEKTIKERKRINKEHTGSKKNKGR